ncbi:MULTISPECIES: hypothetical protein [Streptomyces]|uniref:Uncharacterized protein n=1 Tax=Streptomyces viridochromogenes TaxID=1938 RepID=A0A0L8JPL1_STRVR|nr:MULTISPECIES: hypothetical protein [Streptomyces]KOG15596.1 hypothetical protein ADK34_27480 [Streptomyces viridochromogenes]
MNRRNLLKSAVALGLGAPLASLAAATPAHAAGNYDVLVTEQVKNKLMLFRAINPWTPENLGWEWQAPNLTEWDRLNDARFRETDRFGWTCMVAAGGGRVGMVNFGDDDALLWSANAGGNPHAVEYLRSHGVVVVASAGAISSTLDYPGYLSIYAPTDADDPASLGSTPVDRIAFQGAHGLWWDGSHLYALGTWTLAKYRITGSLKSARLELVQKHVWATEFGGHSLDMDFTDPSRLILNGGGALWTVEKSNLALTNIRPQSYGVKSFSRAVDGESFWVQAIDVTDPGKEGWWNEYVQFFDPTGKPSYRRGLDYYGYEGRFYRSRISSIRLS